MVFIGAIPAEAGVRIVEQNVARAFTKHRLEFHCRRTVTSALIALDVPPFDHQFTIRRCPNHAPEHVVVGPRNGIEVLPEGGHQRRDGLIGLVICVRRQVDIDKAAEHVRETDRAVAADVEIVEAPAAEVNGEGRGNLRHRVIAQIEVCSGNVPVVVVRSAHGGRQVAVQHLDVHCIPAPESRRVSP